jgi:hypothetical protein
MLMQAETKGRMEVKKTTEIKCEPLPKYYLYKKKVSKVSLTSYAAGKSKTFLVLAQGGYKEMSSILADQ